MLCLIQHYGEDKQINYIFEDGNYQYTEKMDIC